jgi:ABC-type branched-subunit amino acid transport system ATPase component
LLRVTDLRRTFGGVHAVDGASFVVRQGTITGLIGPNGAGKSTAIGMIAGAIRPTSGGIEFAGREVTREPAYRMARLGLTRTFQLSSEFAKLTVLENLLVAAPGQRGESLWGAFLGKPYWRRQERALVEQARDLMSRFAMTEKEDEYAGNLSGGQKRLVEIMRALMARPKLLLLDEPMAGVNPTLAGRIAAYLEELRDGGLTMLLVEHELAHVDRLCNPVVVMAQGKVLAEGTMAELRARREVVDAYLVG